MLEMGVTGLKSRCRQGSFLLEAPGRVCFLAPFRLLEAAHVASLLASAFTFQAGSGLSSTVAHVPGF